GRGGSVATLDTLESASRVLDGGGSDRSIGAIPSVVRAVAEHDSIGRDEPRVVVREFQRVDRMAPPVSCEPGPPSFSPVNGTAFVATGLHDPQDEKPPRRLR